MENPQLLTSTESFSYSWLINTHPPNYNNPTSFRKSSDFNFDFPVITSPLHFADEIFSNGQIRAAYDDVLMSEVKAETTNLAPSSPILLQYSASTRRRYEHALEKWRKSSKRILRTCLGYMCKTLRRNDGRVDDLERKVLEASREASPGHGSVVGCWSSDYCYNKLDSNFNADENLIREAILYCKRSIEK